MDILEVLWNTPEYVIDAQRDLRVGVPSLVKRLVKSKKEKEKNGDGRRGGNVDWLVCGCAIFLCPDRPVQCGCKIHSLLSHRIFTTALFLWRFRFQLANVKTLCILISKTIRMIFRRIILSSCETFSSCMEPFSKSLSHLGVKWVSVPSGEKT